MYLELPVGEEHCCVYSSISVNIWIHRFLVEIWNCGGKVWGMGSYLKAYKMSPFAAGD